MWELTDVHAVRPSAENSQAEQRLPRNALSIQVKICIVGRNWLVHFVPGVVLSRRRWLLACYGLRLSLLLQTGAIAAANASGPPVLPLVLRLGLSAEVGLALSQRARRVSVASKLPAGPR